MGTESTLESLTVAGSGANRQFGGLKGSIVEMVQLPPGGKTYGGAPSKSSSHVSAGLGVGVAGGGVGLTGGVGVARGGVDDGVGVGAGVIPGDVVGEGLGVPGVGVGGAPSPRS